MRTGMGAICATLARYIVLAIVMVLTGPVASAVAFLPQVTALARENPRTTAMMEYRALGAAARGRRAGRDQLFVPLARISPYLQHAVLIAEDSSFYEHNGLDFVELPWCIREDFRQRRFAAGCSTITQQLARNLFLSPRKTLIRKATEALVALELERELPKRRILELYLNYIEWGDGVYGCEAASRLYYGTSAADLEPGEAIRMASVIFRPLHYAPGITDGPLLGYQRDIARYMHETGYLTDQEYRSLWSGK